MTYRAQKTAPSDPRPFVKSCGGKARLADVIRPYLPASPIAYHEPFVGGGAMFFRHFRDVRPAFLSDTNERLIITYQAVRDDVEGVLAELRWWRDKYSLTRDTYNLIRDSFNCHWRDSAPCEVAGWFIALNKLSMNGLYRENAAGEYNVPFGRHKNPRICDEANLRACSTALQGVSIECEDFETALRRVEPGKEPRRVAVYSDSPYIPTVAGQSFTRYGRNGFHLEDHVRLAAEMRTIDYLGVSVVASNSDTWVTRDIFRGFKMRQIVGARSVGAGADRRAPALELIIHNRRAR